MQKERIIITPDNPDHHLEQVVDQNGIGHLFVRAFGIHGINEISDYIVHAGDRVQYHVHTYGYELFIIVKGSVDAILGGKRAVAEKGDMLLVPPHTPHAFLYREDGTTWHELLQELMLWDNNLSVDRMIANCPEKMADEAFMDKYGRSRGRLNYRSIEVLDSTEVSPTELPGFSGKGGCYKRYDFPGIVCKIKYPRWQLGGVKEIWEFILEKDMAIDWGEHYHSHELIVVREGRVKVEVQGCEPMIANPEDIISIPDFTAHRLTALEPGTLLQDFNVQHDLFLMLEEISISHKLDKSALTPERLRDIWTRYDCPITEVTGLFKR